MRLKIKRYGNSRSVQWDADASLPKSTTPLSIYKQGPVDTIVDSGLSPMKFKEECCSSNMPIMYASPFPSDETWYITAATGKRCNTMA